MRSLAILLLLLSVSAVKAQLPEVTTTEAQVLEAHNQSVNNENWFISKGAYISLFRNTPVAINHAFERFAQLKKKYNAIDCTEKDILSPSPSVKNADGTLNIERLAFSVQMEKSEIDRTCIIPVGPVKVIQLVSIGGGRPVWMIMVNPRD